MLKDGISFYDVSWAESEEVEYYNLYGEKVKSDELCRLKKPLNVNKRDDYIETK